MVSKIVILLALVLLNIAAWFIAGMLVWKNYRPT